MTEMKMCECGCGTLIPAFDSRGRPRRYVLRHGRRRKEPIKMVKCACGCGTLIVPIDKSRRKVKYVFGHYWRDKKRSPETIKKMSDGMKGKYGGEKNPNYGKTPSDEIKKKISESLTGRYRGEDSPHYGVKHTPEAKKKMSEAQSGPKHHRWRGGISFEPYCQKFNDKFKESIRNKFDRTCFLCDITEEEYMALQRDRGKRPMKLQVHHVNYDKTCLCEDLVCEFVPLCNSCHNKTTHGDREYWENLIMDKLQTQSLQ